MKTIILKGLAIFLILIIVTSITIDTMDIEFGTVNFFQKHGVFFLIFITLFPRLTLLLSSVATGGFLWWVGWLFFPRVLVAILATISYFHTNPILVVISWIVAFGGETMEKAGIGGRRSKFVFRTYTHYPHSHSPPPHEREQVSIKKDDAIEAEFTKKS